MHALIGEELCRISEYSMALTLVCVQPALLVWCIEEIEIEHVCCVKSYMKCSQYSTASKFFMSFIEIYKLQ